MQLEVKYEIVPYTRGRGLNVNPSRVNPPHYAHFIGADEDQLRLFKDGVFDFIYTEGMENAGRAWRVIKPGGHLVIYSKEVEIGINKGFDMVRSEKFNGSELAVLKKRKDKKVNIETSRRPDKSVCIVRYGGIGDMIQTSSIFPALKEQGYHITVNTDPQGYRIVKHDPHIDDFIIQDKAQVPNEELKAYWDQMATKFGKFINLSESVEGTFLALPNRVPFYWPSDVRHALYNVNYMEHIHRLAGVPLPHRERFYPTDREKAWAKKQRKKIKGPVILWTMAGSSVHKTWPFLDAMVARAMLEWPDVHFVLVGDGLCQLLERGWEAEKRVILRSGKWSVRKTLTFAEYADLVIGPETGVMAATAMLDIPKIIFMSHASVENLTKYWVNCASMEPQGVPCYPCHQLHYGYDGCVKNEDYGVAECQVKIEPDRVWSEIKRIVGELK